MNNSVLILIIFVLFSKPLFSQTTNAFRSSKTGGNELSRYDSSYDFSQISQNAHNPKVLIGQELEFAPQSLNHKVGSSVSIIRDIKDTFFLRFSTTRSVALHDLVSTFPKNSTGFDIVDGSRHPSDYSFKFLTDSATTHTYMPHLLFTDRYPFGVRGVENAAKMRTVIGTPYSALAGRTFKIKDVSSYYDYFSSSVLYIFTLIDDKNDELTFFYSFHVMLYQLIHLKGYIKRVNDSTSKQTYSFVSNFQLKRQSDSKVFGYKLFSGYYDNRVPVYGMEWKSEEYNYISTPERPFQMLHLKLINPLGQVVYVHLYDLPD